MARQKVALVTGGASGIGRAAADAFIDHGYVTVIVDRDEALGRKVEAELQEKGEGLFIRADVANDKSIRLAIEQGYAAYGRLDAAFNAAGIAGDITHATADSSAENWDRVIGIDLTGVWSSMRYEIPHMLKNGGGSIVNCASVAGLVGAPLMSAYVAAKHGVVGLTKAAALEYARQGIRVNAVCPGMTDTPLPRSGMSSAVIEKVVQDSPIGRIGQPSEIAATVLWLCDEGAGFLTGQAIAVDGGMTAR